MNEALFAMLEDSYDLTVNKRENLLFTCPAIDLLDENKLKQLLAFYTPLVKGMDPSVGEVYMAGWFRGPMLGLLYTLSVLKQAPDLSLNNLTVQIYKAEYNNHEYIAVSFYLHNSEFVAAPLPLEEQEMWIKDKISSLFEHTIRPVFDLIAKVGTLKVGMLWSQLPTSLEYGYDRMLSAEADEQVKQSIVTHFKMVKSLDGEVFGRSKNPLDVKFRMTESLGDKDKQVRLKAACCLYYLVDGGYYCYTCPRVKESVRVEQREEYRCKQQA
ncbi:(2Fe-2S)-binding protein [Paenibacillus sp. NRS-1760]|uniref:(2Fe-2S)-binding protein n=1 Tax=Paenibacillus sp. NRS-1760 TaxID=3233902 RepID=UPI003D26532D